MFLLHTPFPILPHLLNLALIIQVGIIMLAHTSEAFPPGEMLRVNSHAMVIVFAAGANVLPAALLLFEIEARGIGEEEDGDQHSH